MAPDDEPLECLDGHPGADDDACEGAVELRYPMSPTGRWFPRCEKHYEKRLEIQEGINQRYPTHQPADFDPLYAGERWDDDY